jgi:hypothetical protein
MEKRLATQEYAYWNGQIKPPYYDEKRLVRLDQIRGFGLQFSSYDSNNRIVSYQGIVAGRTITYQIHNRLNYRLTGQITYVNDQTQKTVKFQFQVEPSYTMYYDVISTDWIPNYRYSYDYYNSYSSIGTLTPDIVSFTCDYYALTRNFVFVIS